MSYRGFTDLILGLASSNPLLFEAFKRIDSSLIELYKNAEGISIATPSVGPPPIVSGYWSRSGADVYPASFGDNVRVKDAVGNDRVSIFGFGRMFNNAAYINDLISGTLSVNLWLDPNNQAGIGGADGFGGEFNFPGSGTHLDLIRCTGKLGTDVLAASSEFSALRFELINKGPNLNSEVRGVIGEVKITDGGHARALYGRVTGEAGSTGVIYAITGAVGMATTQAAATGIGLFLHCTGAPNRAYAIQIFNDAGEGWAGGIVFEDAFESANYAIRFRQAAIHGRVQWGADVYIESGTAGRIDIDTIDSYPTALRINEDNGSFNHISSIAEEITLSTVGATTDSVADLLPFDSLILGVSIRITEAVTGPTTSFDVGDAVTANRFRNIATLTLGFSRIGFRQLETQVNVALVGPVQSNDAKLRITANGGTPTAGKVRVVVFYIRLGKMTS